MKNKREISEIDLLKELNNKIEKLTAIMAIQGNEVDEQVRILSILGYTIPEIAGYVGLSTRSINTIKSKLKKLKKIK